MIIATYNCFQLPLHIGEFGVVYKAYLSAKNQATVVTDTVAIKTLKGSITMHKILKSNIKMTSKDSMRMIP